MLLKFPKLLKHSFFPFLRLLIKDYPLWSFLVVWVATSRNLQTIEVQLINQLCLVLAHYCMFIHSIRSLSRGAVVPSGLIICDSRRDWAYNLLFSDGNQPASKIRVIHRTTLLKDGFSSNGYYCRSQKYTLLL